MSDRSAEVHSKLRSLIIRGRLAPGVRVVENEIAERLGVSRTPAREAVQRLYGEGFLVATSTTRRTELVVAPLTRADLLDLYRLMGALEGSAAQRIGELTTAIRRKLATQLKGLQNEFERAAKAERRDYDVMFEKHNSFHERLVAACASPRVRGLIEIIRPQAERYEWVYAPLVGPDHSQTFAEHAAIIHAVRNGSGDEVERAVVANWECGAERLALVIDEAGPRGDWQDLSVQLKRRNS